MAGATDPGGLQRVEDVEAPAQHARDPREVARGSPLLPTPCSSQTYLSSGFLALQRAVTQALAEQRRQQQQGTGTGTGRGEGGGCDLSQVTMKNMRADNSALKTVHRNILFLYANPVQKSSAPPTEGTVGRP